MKRLIKKSFFTCNVKPGDYVDFGQDGKFYVCNPYYNDSYFWVTSDKSQRNNYNARGFSILKSKAMKVLESVDNLVFIL